MSLNVAQKKAVKDFKNICSANEKTALECLRKNNFNVNQALDYYYNNQGSFDSSTPKGRSQKADNNKLNTLFAKYADPKNKEIMAGEPLGQFFRDVGVDPEKDGAVTLGFAYTIRCKTLGEIKKTEFVEGLSTLNADTAERIRQEMQTIRGQIGNRTWFKDFWRWLFDFCKEDSERRSLDMEPALEMMSTALPQHFPLLTEFLEFLRARREKTFTKDNWDMTLEFGKEIKSDLSNYEDECAFPALFDDFVAFVRAARARKGGGTTAAAASTSSGATKKSGS